MVIEHNLEVIKTADWVIEMGPQGGDGGRVVVRLDHPSINQLGGTG
jgi:excinuclease ABC subunit A